MGSLLYIHGFNSSPQGIKGQLLKKAMASQGIIQSLKAPKLETMPLQAIAQLETIIKETQKPILIGSSLGGYYATYLAEKFQLKAVLVNPVVLPHKLFGKSYTKHLNYDDDKLSARDSVSQLLKTTYEYSPIFINNYFEELKKLEVFPPSDKNRYKVWLKMGDELLDYRFARDWYKNCDLQIDEGGDHSFSDFAKCIPNILKWANLLE